MPTQYEHAVKGAITPEMDRAAEREHLPPETIRAELAAGRLVIPANAVHLKGAGRVGQQAHAVGQADGRVGQQAHAGSAPISRGTSASSVEPPVGPPYGLDPIAIGRAVATKINANIGASPVSSCKDLELTKLRWAVKYGADAVMDLSTGGDLDDIRAHLIAQATVPLGTVPIYSMIVAKPIEELTCQDMLSAIARQAQQGVDFFTIHAGILRRHLDLIGPRKLGIVSRGGSLLAKWMLHHGRENPLYEMFDEISAICRQYDVTYSLGDGLRPGCLADASDAAQFAELETLGELVPRARAAGVQCMVEGPGHVPLDQIEMNMKRQEKTCHGAPFYVLGPVVADVFPGYDHITSAIGAALAAWHGASFLCYVTPAEHLSLPTPEDVKAGCIAYKIAAHAADVARRLPGARKWDDDLAEARANLDWPRQFALAFDSDTARQIRQRDLPDNQDYCAMCGRSWCAVRLSREVKESLRQKT